MLVLQFEQMYNKDYVVWQDDESTDEFGDVSELERLITSNLDIISVKSGSSYRILIDSILLACAKKIPQCVLDTEEPIDDMELNISGAKIHGHIDYTLYKCDVTKSDLANGRFIPPSVASCLVIETKSITTFENQINFAQAIGECTVKDSPGFVSDGKCWYPILKDESSNKFISYGRIEVVPSSKVNKDRLKVLVELIIKMMNGCDTIEKFLETFKVVDPINEVF
eukprot:TRINITY_DN773177_c0_g1_i1.p1 TRINITY_DN773177_c0_g1~~TRINITY_DN773177_c0_g1_i1.p1  ORF type:complete len:225 (+),score=51.63 TRINITY_DN773177_c0_g1_i1:206-880(+)